MLKHSSNKFLNKKKLTYFQCSTSMEDGPPKLLAHKHTQKITREEGNEENHMAAIILLNKKDGS